jgi:ferredoxin-thioredoxin reductase catalytic chain
MTPEGLYGVLSKYAESKRHQLNSDREFVLEILTGLLKNEERYGYRSCPCRLASGIKERDADIICPCAYKDPDVSEYGSCFCALYVSKEWNEGITEHRFVPERRPPERH